MLAFMMVLQVERIFAEFFLESADWQLNVAVGLWLENAQYVNPQAYSEPMADEDESGMTEDDIQRQRHVQAGASTSEALSFGHEHKRIKMNAYSNPSPDQHHINSIPKQITVAELPVEWLARISRTNGSVYFINTITKHTQYEWPGFQPPINDLVDSGLSTEQNSEPSQSHLVEDGMFPSSQHKD